MKIVELKQSSPERITLVFDNGSEIKSTLSLVTERFLHSGLELGDEEYSELLSASSLSLCRQRAIFCINARPLSRKELIDKLIGKGETEENAISSADWLCNIGLINDESYAAVLVRHYSAKGYGKMRIRKELNRHGVPREMFETALEEMPEQDEYLERFIRTRLHEPNDRAEVKKVSDALMRRGYSWDEIKHALNSYISQEDYK